MLSTIKSRISPETQTPSVAVLLASWPKAARPPRLLGKPKKDLPIDEWLAKVAEVCVANKVPRTLWHEVARHFMSDEALRRLEDVEKVMQHVCGHKWGWKWSTFGVALKNMGWNIDPKRTEAVKVQRKTSGMWWIVGRGGDQGTQIKTKEPLPELGLFARAAGIFGAYPSPTAKTIKKPVIQAAKHKKGLKSLTKRQERTPVISRTLSRFTIPLRLTGPPPPPTTVTAQVPIWLLAASEALLAVTRDRSTTMSVLAAVLITVGSIPSLPVVSAGATAHALGSVAIGLGTLLRERALAEAAR